MSEEIHLNGFVMNCVGHHSPGIWTHPRDHAENYTDLDYWLELARIMERGKFDSMFFADVLGTYSTYKGSRDTAVRHAVQTPTNDPLVLIPALARETDHLGFASTFSVTYHPPYKAAKLFSTLDHLTNGRIAWNIVTSYLKDAAQNMGLEERIPHDERYDRADEYMEVCYKLWEESWEDDAVVKDREKGMYADPDKVHEIHHDGTYFNVPGPHISEPSPQRTPALYQAGQSDRGREFAARHAEAVFTFHTNTESCRQYVEDIRSRAESYGRDPDQIKVITGVSPIVGSTEEIAQAKYDDLRSHVSYDGALSLIGGWTDMDLSQLEPDQPVEHIESDAIQGVVEAFTTADPDRDWTVEKIAKFLGVGGAGYPVVGTPVQVADELERWVEEGHVDGFNIFPVHEPGVFRDFVDLVVPELQDRGLHRTSYEHPTMRERIRRTSGARLPEEHPGTEFSYKEHVSA